MRTYTLIVLFNQKDSNRVVKHRELLKNFSNQSKNCQVARNQMESMMCILWQVEEPKNQGPRNMQQYYFESTSLTIVRIWSSWLVKHNSESFDFAPAGVEKLYLESPDEMLMEFLPTFDVVVFSSGHWFVKQSLYILNNEIVGGQLWWPDKSRLTKINSVEAFDGTPVGRAPGKLSLLQLVN
ncbi:Protein yls7 [Trifolium repens]|nr:Protein yls7 [Trifolium repens]